MDNPVNILSITNPRPHSDDPEHRRLKKDLIMICARVHPGETNSSFACEGLIRFLLSDSEEANNFRTHFIIKIVPFLNPDGVIHGNYRTSLSGHDLNRRWKRPDKNLHPEICAIKKYLT
jgi:murein tripeptide amidase MpaA